MDVSHKTHVARLSNLAAANLRARSPTSDDEEDAEEAAFFEKLRKVQAEEDHAGNDPFGLGAGRATAASTYNDERLAAEAQKVMEMLGKGSFSMGGDEDVGSFRPSIWSEDADDETDEVRFKAQQARLKALAAAAGPASHVRTQVTRANVPKPPGLVDPEKQKRMKERLGRLSIAETAAVAAVTGVGMEEVKVIQPHIEELVKAKVGVVDRASAEPIAVPATRSTIAPPPGLGPPLVAAPAPVAPQPPKSALSSASITTAQPLPSAEVEKRKSSAFLPTKSASPSPSSSPAKPDSATGRKSVSAATLEVTPRKSLAKITVIPVNDDDEEKVQLMQETRVGRGFLDVMSWQTPLTSLGWLVFGIAFVATVRSASRWSTLSLWCLFALVRLLVLRITNLLQGRLPEKVSAVVLPKDRTRLPGSLRFAGDLLWCVSMLLRIIQKHVSDSNAASFGLLFAVSIVGFKLNIGICFAIVAFLTSLILAIYKTLPQAFAPMLAGFPAVKEVLERI